MHNHPRVVFWSQDSRNPQGNAAIIISPANLRLETLDLHKVRELLRHVLRDGVETKQFAARVVGCGALDSFGDLRIAP